MHTALVNFVESLDRVRDIANDAIVNTPQSLTDAALRRRQETTMSAVVVTISGYFESFLRELAEQYVDEICRLHYPFLQLNDSIRRTHFTGGGKVLTGIGGKKRSSWYSWTNATASDVAERLASVEKSPPYKLVWEAFAETRGNPGKDVIKDFLVRFGVSKPMETLADQMGMTVNTLSTRLDSFIAVRNECAHTGTTTSTWTPVDVLNHCAFLQDIAKGLFLVLKGHQVQ